MASPTSNFGWLRPTVGGDNDIWGDYLNTNLTNQDALIRRVINSFINSSAPSEAQNGTFWLDNTSNPWILNIYDGAAWVSIGNINPTTHNFSPSGIGINFYVGDYKFSTQSANHGSWLLCNGQSVSTSTYSGLFAQIGYNFGGAGSNFNVPDMRGRVPGTIGSGTGLSTRTMGQSLGEETHVLTTPEIPTHTHFISSPDQAPFISGPLTNTNQLARLSFNQSVEPAYALEGSPTAATIGLSSSTGGGGSHNNMQPTLFVGNYFIFSGV